MWALQHKQDVSQIPDSFPWSLLRCKQQYYCVFMHRIASLEAGITGCQHVQALVQCPCSVRLMTGMGAARGPAGLRSPELSRLPQQLRWRLRDTGRSSKRMRACRVRQFHHSPDSVFLPMGGCAVR